MQERYDVIIVGGGPAGAMAACLLGQAGCRTLVLERHRLPRYKPCGGAIPAQVFATLPAACAPAIERRVNRARFRFRGREAAHALDGTVAMVMRDRFDSLLLAQAAADVHDGEAATGLEIGRAGVTVQGERGRYHAAHAIAADGAFSLLARLAGLQLGLRPGPALEAELPVPEALIAKWAETALFDVGAMPGGYAWVFPKGDHLSLGVGSFRGGARGLRRRLQALVAGLGLPAGHVRPRGHALPLYRRRQRLQAGGLLLAGDAAGLVDPLSGEGIRHALASGRLAAEAILSGETATYSQRVHEEIGRDLSAALWLARLFYGLPRLCFHLGARDRAIVGGLMRVLAGQATYRELIRRVPGYFLRRLGGR